MERAYGSEPMNMGVVNLDFEEYMHWMYLPVLIPESEGRTVIPPQLEFARLLIDGIIGYELGVRHSKATHVYVTARRGYATPGNPLNRPGWHSDGFGTEDVNYVWTDRFPTLFALHPFTGISDDHVLSAQQFEEQIERDSVVTYADRTMLRLDSAVVHAAPEIPAPGGERSFFKVSFATSRYNLRGNARNHGIDYDWPLHDREQLRNDPAHALQDGVS